jgi:hypothetical protein
MTYMNRGWRAAQSGTVAARDAGSSADANLKRFIESWPMLSAPV